MGQFNEDYKKLSILLVGSTAGLYGGKYSIVESGITTLLRDMGHDVKVASTQSGSLDELVGLMDNSDVALLYADLSGFERAVNLVTQIRKASQKGIVVLYKKGPNQMDVDAAKTFYTAGINAYIAQSDVIESDRHLLSGINYAYKGFTYTTLPQALMPSKKDRSRYSNVTRLTPREVQVAELLIREQLSNREIAERLKIRVRTIEAHVSSILQKNGLSSRTELIAANSQLR